MSRQPGSPPVQVTMQPLHSQPSQDPLASQEPPMPVRWRSSIDNLESALSAVDQLAQALDGALYLDDDEWQKALPVHKYNMALQVQHQRIGDLERQLAEVGARLAESERGRARAEAKAKELNGELENNARVFQLHYEELMRKEKEIADLQAVVSALSLGSGGGPGSDSGEGGGLGGGSSGGGGGDLFGLGLGGSGGLQGGSGGLGSGFGDLMSGLESIAELESEVGGEGSETEEQAMQELKELQRLHNLQL